MDKINKNLDSQSRWIDILKNSNFLRLFKIFIDDYKSLSEDLSNLKNTHTLKEQFSKINYIETFKEKNEYNLFMQFGKFFNDEYNLAVFIQFLHNYKNIHQKTLNSFLKIWDFLLESYQKNQINDNNLYKISDEYKKNVQNIISNHEIKNPNIELWQIWFPTISPFWYPIEESDLNDSISFNDFNWDINFIYSRDTNNNEFYQNIDWIILKDNNKKIITKIYSKKEKMFWEHIITPFENEDWEKYIMMRDSVNLWIDFNTYKADNFNIKYTNIETNWEKNKFEYLLLSSNLNKTVLLNQDLIEINALDLIKFINTTEKSNFLDIKLSDLEDYPAIEIFWIYEFNKKRFIKLKTTIKDKEIICIISDSWKILLGSHKYWEAYIQDLYSLESVVWKEFVTFSNWGFWIDGFIDLNWDVIKIEVDSNKKTKDSFWNKKNIKEYISLVDIEKNEINEPVFKSYPKSYLINDKYFFNEMQLKNQLSSYTWFNQNYTEFEAHIEDLNIEYKKEKIINLLGKLDNNWEIEFKVETKDNKENITKEEFAKIKSKLSVKDKKELEDNIYKAVRVARF